MIEYIDLTSKEPLFFLILLLSFSKGIVHCSMPSETKENDNCPFQKKFFVSANDFYSPSKNDFRTKMFEKCYV